MNRFILLTSLLISVFTNAADIGSKAPDFTLESLKNVTEGQKISLASYKGKIVYVDFWASWCGPCQASFPSLEAIRTKYKDKGFEVIAINVDEDIKDANNFLTKYPVSFPIARDSSGKTAEQYKVQGMPTAYIVDQKGIIQHIVTGFDVKTEVGVIENTIKTLAGK